MKKTIGDQGDLADPEKKSTTTLSKRVSKTPINLKNASGLSKAPVNNIPSVAIFALGAAMADGARKYLPFNWRESEVTASIFFDADQRHIWDWWEGEDYAPDSLVHHLAHQMACCAIILDAIQQGNFIDDRPKVKRIGASRKAIWKMMKEQMENAKTTAVAEGVTVAGGPPIPPLGIPKNRWNQMSLHERGSDTKERKADTKRAHKKRS